MNTDVIGQVKNTPLAKNKGLYALFETISNSIHAIEDAKTEAGKITIEILRSQATLAGIDRSSNITDFVVTDNGIGFTEQNYHSFNETSSQLKLKRGGKGLGRFTLLKVFNQVEISSVYQKDEQYFSREFTFSLANKSGITEHTRQETSATGVGSMVALKNIRKEYKKIPVSTTNIANKVIEHFLTYFVLGKMPSIVIVDKFNDETIDLWKLYEKLVAETSSTDISIKSVDFRIVHFVLQSSTTKEHRLYFTGNQRVGQEATLIGKIPHLPKSLSLNDEGKYVYAGYISSTYLDERLNPVRTNFDIPNKSDNDGFFEELGWDTILEHIYTACADYLSPYTLPFQEDTVRRVKTFVENNAPEYRYIVKHRPDLIDQIPPDADDDKIDQQLHAMSREVEADLRQQARAFFNEDESSSEEDYHQKRKAAYDKFFAQINDLSKSKLAKYILERKLVLDVFEHSLQIDDQQRYAREEQIHELIFPMRKSSDDIQPTDHNLWIIDEKLAYHHYLASDIQLKQIEVLENSSISRPDIVIFNNRFVITDEPANHTTGIVIFEIKRPMRGEYKEDPLSQIYRYVREIKNGKKKDKRGRYINIIPGTPFYCYVLCDLTPKVVDTADLAGLQRTPDQLGFFGYNSTYGTYVEIISFDKLLQDAKKRNRILFENLHLPTTID